MTTNEYNLPEATVHDEGAEQAVLGVILAHPTALVDIRRTMSMEDFYKPANQIIFKTACKLDDDNLPIEPRAILSALTATGEIKRIPNGASYLSDLFGQAPVAASVGHYVRLVREASTRRSLSLIGMQLQQRSTTDGEASISQILEQARGTLDNLAIERLATEVPMIADVLPITLDELEKLSKNGAIMGVPTGFVDLDKSLNGLQSGQMIVIAARPGVGKALSLDTKIPTPTGWTTMGKVQEGDFVLGRDGKPTKVIATTEVMLDRPCYKVEFSDGSAIKADEKHLWTVWSPKTSWVTIDTLEIAKALFVGEHFSVPATHNNRQRSINNILQIKSIPVRCIEVDALDHLFLAGETMIPTHNSSLAMDVARHAAFRQKKSVIVFSLEMSAPELVMRMLSAEAHVDSQALRTGSLTEEIWQKLAKATTTMSGSKLAIDDTATVTISEIRAKARAIQRLHGLDLIVIDYLQLMNADNRSDSRQQEVSDMSRGVKLLAKEFKIPVIVLSQLNRGPEQRQDKRPVISDLRESGCVTGDTQLLRSDNGAPITFDELMANGFDDVYVWSVDKERKMVPGKITNVFASGIMETYLLKLASGREVKASGNHKFLSFGGWKALDQLKIGERLAIPRTIPISSESKGLGWSEYRLGLLGHLLGDGCVLKGQPIHYTNGDELNLTFVESAAEEFGITPRRDRPEIGNWENVYLPSPYHTGRGLKNPINIWFDDMGIADLRSYEKKIPTILFEANKPETAIFLKHLFATDGGVWNGGKAGTYKIHYTSSSRELIDGVALLLSRFGIIGRIRKVMYKLSPRPGYQLSISDSPSILTFANEIGIHGLRGEQLKSLTIRIGTSKTKTNSDTFPVEIWSLIESERNLAGVTKRAMKSDLGVSSLKSASYKLGISRTKLERIAQYLNSDLLKKYAEDDIFWDKIVSMESLGNMPVYDATVEDNHNFIANSIVLKNSIEQDADVVILLHREEMYEKESPRAGEADVIIAKQRSGPTGTISLAWQAKYTKFANLEMS